MKKYFALATFVVASVGAVGVGAATMTTFAGSDTLGNVTHDMINTTSVSGSPFCTGPYASAQTLVYTGGGSSLGETDMIAGTQAIAPMSRFLGTNICDGGVSNGEGVVISLDGVSIVTSATTGGAASCNGPSTGTSCVNTDGGAPYPTDGLAIDTTVTTRFIGGVNQPYTFVSWQDVLKVLYFGKIDSGFHPTDPEVGTNCNSQLRQTLANNWSELFESPSNCTGCSILQHIFRRDDASGTTDIFASLLGFSGPNAAKGTAVTVNSQAYQLGSDNFCNDPGGNTPAGFPGSNENTPNVWTSSGTAVAGATSNIVPNDDQDLDLIRRPCTEIGRGAHEQVCEPGSFDQTNTLVKGTAATGFTYACGATGSGTCPSGESCLNGQCWGSWDPLQTQVTNTATGPTYKCGATGSGACPAPETCNAAPNGSPGNACWAAVNQGSLGLLLPVITDNGIGSYPGSAQYAIAPCGGSTFVNAPSFKVTGQRAAVYGACPNGDQPSAGVCSVPADITQTPPNPNCLANGSTVNPPSILSTQGISGGGPSPANVDQRVFNKFVWQNTGSATAPSWSYALDDSARPMTGAFSRIHTNQTMLNGNAAGCAYLDATDQIGCLVQASPCSIGYAGRESTTIAGPTGAVNVQSLKIKGRPDAIACIQTFQYPYSRKLYLDTIVGFLNATPADQALALCESQESIVNQAINAEGFVPLPPTGTIVIGQSGQQIDEGINGGAPFCEDFNEQLLCGAPSNNNGCATNSQVVGAAGAGSLPSVQTTCGNGIQESFEDCDLGTPGTANQLPWTLISPSAGSGSGNGSLPSPCSTTCRFNQ
ncbi:MAG: hypothetical protein ABSC94_16810 [Polyangiaceae bacterium]